MPPTAGTRTPSPPWLIGPAVSGCDCARVGTVSVRAWSALMRDCSLVTDLRTVIAAPLRIRSRGEAVGSRQRQSLRIRAVTQR